MNTKKERIEKTTKSLSKEIAEMLKEVRGGASTYSNSSTARKYEGNSKKKANFYNRFG